MELIRSHLDRAGIERIAARYRGRWYQGYARGKLRRDPLYGATLAALRDSVLPTLDLGCGMGLFECYAREAGQSMPLVGVDLDERKVTEARRATAGYDGVEFHAGDVREYGGLRGNVLLLDVLQYLPAPAQESLLERVRPLVAPGGCCVVRVALRDGGWRYRLTQALEWWIRAIGWMRVSGRHFPSREEVEAPFRRAGFACESVPNWGGTPLNSHLLVFRAPEPA